MNPLPIPKLVDLGLPLGPAHPCPYLPGMLSRERAFAVEALPPGVYDRLLAYGWRRTGHVIYKPFCAPCTACVPQRIAVASYTLSKNERRVLARNRDLRVEEGELRPDRERFDLFVRYQQGRHAGDMCTEWEEFVSSLYSSPVHSREFAFFHDDRIVAAAIVDREPQSLSAVYTYFDPRESRRGLGTLAILWSLQFAALHRIPYYYLGYYVADCQRMNYKERFRPCQYGNMQGGWTNSG